MPDSFRLSVDRLFEPVLSVVYELQEWAFFLYVLASLMSSNKMLGIAGDNTNQFFLSLLWQLVL